LQVDAIQNVLLQFHCQTRSWVCKSLDDWHTADGWLEREREAPNDYKISNKKRPETWENEFILKDATDLFQDKLFHLPYVLEHLLSIILLADFTFNPHLFQQAAKRAQHGVEVGDGDGDGDGGRVVGSEIRTRIVGRQEATVDLSVDVSHDGDAIKGKSRDAQLERDADEALHRVVQLDLCGQNQAEVAGVLDASDDLEIVGAPIRGFPGKRPRVIVIVVIDVVAVVAAICGGWHVQVQVSGGRALPML
jgi:hypothetical protein